MSLESKLSRDSLISGTLSKFKTFQSKTKIIFDPLETGASSFLIHLRKTHRQLLISNFLMPRKLFVTTFCSF